MSDPHRASHRPSHPTGGFKLGGAMAGNETLAGLLERVAQSRLRLAAIADLLPDGLAATTRAGPLDAEAWLLLVDNAAAAAKLRQLLPTFESRLKERGWTGPPVKVRVQVRA